MKNHNNKKIIGSCCLVFVFCLLMFNLNSNNKDSVKLKMESFHIDKNIEKINSKTDMVAKAHVKEVKERLTKKITSTATDGTPVVIEIPYVLYTLEIDESMTKNSSNKFEEFAKDISKKSMDLLVIDADSGYELQVGSEYVMHVKKNANDKGTYSLVSAKNALFKINGDKLESLDGEVEESYKKYKQKLK